MTTAEDAAEAAGSTIGTWLKTLGGTAATGAGAVGAQSAADPFMAWLSAVFALATAGMTMIFVGARVVSTCFEIAERFEKWKLARIHRRYERQMMDELGLAPTNPDELDTRPAAHHH